MNIVAGESYDLEPPKDLQDRLTRLGGRNIYGDPNFRVVWGWKRKTLIGGAHARFDENGEQIGTEVGVLLLQKYYPHSRWYVEAWYPAFHYGTPATWAEKFTEVIDGRKVETLGPYPERGEYEYLARIQSSDGEYIGLTPTVCDKILDYARTKRDNMSRSEKRKRQIEKWEAQERAYDSRDDDILNDIPWRTYKKPHIIVPSSYRRS